MAILLQANISALIGTDQALGNETKPLSSRHSRSYVGIGYQLKSITTPSFLSMNPVSWQGLPGLRAR